MHAAPSFHAEPFIILCNVPTLCSRIDCNDDASLTSSSLLLLLALTLTLLRSSIRCHRGGLCLPFQRSDADIDALDGLPSRLLDVLLALRVDGVQLEQVLRQHLIQVHVLLVSLRRARELLHLVHQRQHVSLNALDLSNGLVSSGARIRWWWCCCCCWAYHCGLGWHIHRHCVPCRGVGTLRVTLKELIIESRANGKVFDTTEYGIRSPEL